MAKGNVGSIVATVLVLVIVGCAGIAVACSGLGASMQAKWSQMQQVQVR